MQDCDSSPGSGKLKISRAQNKKRTSDSMTAKRALALYEVPENLNTSWNSIRYMNHHETNQGPQQPINSLTIAGTFSPPWPPAEEIRTAGDPNSKIQTGTKRKIWKQLLFSTHRRPHSMAIPVTTRGTHTHTRLFEGRRIDKVVARPGTSSSVKVAS